MTLVSPIVDRGVAMHSFMTDAFGLHRSITGEGLRATLRLIGDLVPLQIHEVASGTPVLDWTVPPEWHVSEAFIEDSAGERVLDLSDSTLHVEAYSAAVDTRMPWRALREHVHTLPDHPDRIPYRTSYFDDSWGFCMRYDQAQMLDSHPDRMYRARIDSKFVEGSLSYGEVVLPGETADEFLVWTHTCHPSLANDNLSGVAVATWLARTLSERDLRHTFRFVFAPATIGAITWLAANRTGLAAIRHGLVLTGLGDPAPHTYKQSRRGNAPIDRAAAHVVTHAGGTVQAFDPFGYDERQFCSPGFDLPIGRLTRSPDGTYPEYHTSADDLEFVDPAALDGSLETALGIIDVVETDTVVRSTRPHGEPRLGPLGLHRAYRHGSDRETLEQAVLWTLNLADGRHSLLDIAERSGLPFQTIRLAVGELAPRGLLVSASPDQEETQ